MNKFHLKTTTVKSQKEELPGSPPLFLFFFFQFFRKKKKKKERISGSLMSMSTNVLYGFCVSSAPKEKAMSTSTNVRKKEEGMLG